jgi:hypothetical protein
MAVWCAPFAYCISRLKPAYQSAIEIWFFEDHQYLRWSYYGLLVTAQLAAGLHGIDNSKTARQYRTVVLRSCRLKSCLNTSFRILSVFDPAEPRGIPRRSFKVIDASLTKKFKDFFKNNVAPL